MNTRLQPYLLVALCWAFCLTSFSVFAQSEGVFEGNLRLTTQKEVDAFDCTSVESLTIDVDGTNSDPITNLKALCSLKSIANNLTISAIGTPQLFSLEGLHGLTSIGGNFNLEAADISSMKGLENLKTIGGQLSVYQTPLISFQGLGSLTTIEGAFVLNDIASGDEPISFRGLSVLESVGGIIFTDKDVLAEDFTGLESLKIIRGNLSIGGTEVDGVSSLKGLEGVEEITGDIQFSYERFTSFEGLNNLQRLGGGIILEDNAIESFDGLEKLEVIEGQIIALNNRINNVKGLRSLQTAGGINISDEPLSSLDGLEQLRQVNGSLGFNSTRITSVIPLQGIEHIAGNLSLVGNSDLTECCIIPLLLERVKGEVIIENNAPACNSLEAIAKNCDEPVAGVDCSQEEVVLTTQAEVDAFNCISVGSLVIRSLSNSDDIISNLDSLRSLVTIQNDLLIGNSKLSNLEGLNNVETIGGDFTISGEGSLQGLDQLKSIGGYFLVDNADLDNFVGLESLESIGGDLAFYDYAVDNFEGLSNLKTIGGSIGIFDGDDISFVGLSALKSVGGFEISDVSINNFIGLSSLKKINGSINAGNTEDNIASFEGLENVKEITGNINLAFGNIESWQGLRNLRRIGGNVTIEEQRFETFEGLEKLKEIGGRLYLLRNGVESLQAFKSLQSVGGILIEAEPLTSLDGLEQLRRVNGDFVLFATQVNDITAIQNVESIAGNLRFTSNNQLSECCIIPSLLERVEGEVVLNSNAPACNSLEAIAENCDEPVAGVDCSQEEVVLTTQAQVDAFNCTQVGSLTLRSRIGSEDPINNLLSLSVLNEIKNNLVISIVSNQEQELESLGLTNLSRIGGDLIVESNDQVPGFRGLQQLSTIGGSLILESNTEASNFQGLEQLTTIGGSLILERTNTDNFQGLSRLKTIGGQFFIRASNDELSFNGLTSLTTIDGGISILSSTSTDFAGLVALQKIGRLYVEESFIASFEGLENVTEISGDITVQDAVVDNWTGLENLRRVGGDIAFRNSGTADFIGLESLEEIGGNLDLDGGSLTNFEGLTSLRSVKSIILFAVGRLSSLNGIQELKIDGGFSIYDTPIEDITALQNIDIITGDLSITDNSMLSTCCVIPAIADRVQGSIILERNAPECNSLEAIEENCAEEAPDENARTAQALKAYPNPSANFVQVQVDQPTVVQLFSTAGNLVKEQRVEQEGTIDLTTVKAGVYLLKTPGGRVQRIIKK